MQNAISLELGMSIVVLPLILGFSKHADPNTFVIDQTDIMQISKRELEVLALIAFEYTTKEIANHLFISVDTVKSHRKHLLSKMGARNIAGLVRKGLQDGYIHSEFGSTLKGTIN